MLAAVLAGCGPTADPLPDEITYSEHVAPLVLDKCASCHRAGESAPFKLVDYDDVERRAVQVSQVVRSGYMPPWLPEPGQLEFADDRSLTDREVELIRLWVKQGAPLGDPEKLPPTPEWPAGWLLGEPDLIVELPEYLLAPDGQDVYRNLVVRAPVERTRWIAAVEIRPGNKRVVHHAILQIDPTPASRRLDAEDSEAGFGAMEMGSSEPPDGHFIGWTPGKLPTVAAAGTAWRLDRGTDLVLQLHMLPTGKPEPVRPRIGLHFGEQPSAVRPFVILLAEDAIDIPAGESGYVITDELRLPVAVEVLGLYPHAHYLGKTMEVTATSPANRRTTLIRIDDWDFNWQDEYRYKQPVPLEAGTTVTMRYTYDNSSDNERNPNDPPLRVTSGNRSADEMGTLSLQVLPASEEDRLLLEEAQARHTLQNYPDHHSGHYNLGSSLLARGEAEAAIPHLRRAIEIRPDLDKGHYNLGLALDESGRTQEAIAAYRSALEHNPSHSRAANNLGNALQSQGELPEAIAWFVEATRLQTDFAEAHYNLAGALLMAERADEAIHHYREVLRIEPDDALALSNLGVAFETSGDREAALRSWREALELDPELVEARTNLGRVAAAEGRLD